MLRLYIFAHLFYAKFVEKNYVNYEKDSMIKRRLANNERIIVHTLYARISIENKTRTHLVNIPDKKFLLSIIIMLGSIFGSGDSSNIWRRLKNTKKKTQCIYVMLRMVVWVYVKAAARFSASYSTGKIGRDKKKQSWK